MSVEEVNAFMAIVAAGALPNSIPNDLLKPYLLYTFPDDKKKISKLSHENKLEWYQHQFEKKPGVYPVELVGKEFEQFWKWRMVVPMKIRRFFYRLKNGELFKKYPHITEIKKKLRDNAAVI